MGRFAYFGLSVKRARGVSPAIVALVGIRLQARVPAIRGSSELRLIIAFSRPCPRRILGLDACASPRNDVVRI